LRGARAALAEEIERRFPEYADLVNPKPATVEKVQRVLRPGEALLATYVTDDKTYVWAVPKSGSVKFAATSLGRDQIRSVVRDLRRALDPKAATLGDIPAFDIRLSHRLYRAMLAPVREGWQSADSLLVVADDALGQLPFSVLVTEQTRLAEESGALFSNYTPVPWLARDHAVTALPSVTALATLRALPAANPARRAFVGFGDPFFSLAQAAEGASAKPTQTAALTSRGAFQVRGLPVRLRSAPRTQDLDSAELSKLPRLPDTADEVRSIAVAVDADLTKDVFTGKRASEQMVKSLDLNGYKVLAFATHGLVPGDLNGLTEPALALSSPKLDGSGDDGLLTMGEILGLKLDADWVVLSACNTAAGDGAGAEAFSGLGRAFFYAGTRALLVSNWPVETTSARALTTDLFRRQAKDSDLSRAQALRQSMLTLMDGKGLVDERGRTVFSYAHPIFWAPFSLVGDGGGKKPSI
jgi:CHAT domain-containing protein